MQLFSRSLLRPFIWSLTLFISLLHCISLFLPRFLSLFFFSLSLSLTLSLSNSLSLSLSLSLSIYLWPSLSLALSLSLTTSFSLSLPLSLYLSHSFSHTLSLSLFFSLSLSLSLPLFLSLSLSLSLFLSPTLTLSTSFSLSFSLTLSLSISLSLSLSLSLSHSLSCVRILFFRLLQQRSRCYQVKLLRKLLQSWRCDEPLNKNLIFFLPPSCFIFSTIFLLPCKFSKHLFYISYVNNYSVFFPLFWLLPFFSFFSQRISNVKHISKFFSPSIYIYFTEMHW